MSNFNVSGLSDYVKTNRDVLVKGVVLGDVFGDTIPNLAKQLGIKTVEKLNYLNVSPSIQNGEACGFSASGDTAFTDRTLETAQMKAQDEFCARLLLGKFAEYAVKIGADYDESNLPFKEVILDEVVKSINQKMEKTIWQGKKGTDFIDGFVTLAEGTDNASTIKVDIANGTSVYDAVKQVIMALPEEILDKAVVFLSPANYRAFVQELVELNYFHYESGKIENLDVVFPGTDIRIHKTIGLMGDNKHIYASAYENMVYGADLMNDLEEVRFWYSEDDDLFRYSIRWNAGVMTYFPDMVVLGTIAE